MSEEPEGEDLIQNMEEDYKPIPELDRFEQEGIDDQSMSENLDFDVRRRAEEELEQRDRQKRQ